MAINQQGSTKRQSQKRRTPGRQHGLAKTYTQSNAERRQFTSTSLPPPRPHQRLSPREQVVVPIIHPNQHRGRSIPISVGSVDGLESAVRDTARRKRDRPTAQLATMHLHHRGINKGSQQAELEIQALREGPLAALILAGDALADGPEVMAMGRPLEAMFAAVAALVVGAGEDDKILRTGAVGVFGDPVLGRHVLVADDDAGDARDGVVAGGDAVGLVGLAGQECGGGLVADARGAEGVLASMSACGW